MPTPFIAAVVFLLAGPLAAEADGPEQPEVVAAAEAAPAGDGTQTPSEGPQKASEGPQQTAGAEASAFVLPEAMPWNPPVRKADEWPYKTPLQAGVPDPAPWGDFWFEAEYLLWAIRGQPAPPLVTGGPAASGGILGTPGTAVLFGGSRLDDNPFSGARLTIGMWLDDCHRLAFEGDYFFLGQRSARFAADSGAPGSGVLARPIFNAATGLPDALPIAFPGALSGSVTASAPTFFQGADGNISWTAYRDFRYHIDLLGGFRYLQLDERLITLSTSEASLAGLAASSGITDQFTTRTHFYGGQGGVRADYCWHHLVFGAKALLAVGYDDDVINFDGRSVLRVAGFRPLSAPSGLLVQPSNRGRHTSHGVATVPELDLRLAWQVHEQVQFFTGFTFLYWSDVVRPGDQIDTTVNPFQGPNGPLFGPARPAFMARESAFWAYGLDAGVQIRY